MRGLLILCAVFIFGVKVPAAYGAEDAKHMDFHPTVSPDERQVAYYSYRGAALPDIFVHDIKTGKETNITQSPDLWEIEPAWSPNGKMIAYGAGDSMRSLEIVVHDMHSGKTTNYGEGNGASWSPDSKLIVFARFDQGVSSSVHILTVATGEIVDIDLSAAEGAFSSSPSWLPDGSGLVFSNQIKSGGNSNIYTVDLASGAVKALVKSPLNTGTSFVSGDGKMLYFGGDAYGSKVEFPDNISPRLNHIYGVRMEDAAGEVPLEKFMMVSGELKGQQYFAELAADGKSLYVETGYWDSSTFHVYKLPLAQGMSPVKISGQ